MAMKISQCGFPGPRKHHFKEEKFSDLKIFLFKEP